jgi:2-C-methyl-D-erythritol 2,4-cyclodiphosphate synthase
MADNLFIIRAMDDLAPASFRVGIGYDLHPLAATGPLRLGGIDIPFHLAAIGHSDADVLLHAVTDALLGAGALGDIGDMFPDTDPANRGRDSAEMMRLAHERLRAAGYRIVNLDCVVVAEQPKLTPYKAAIRGRIAEILGLTIEQVGVKAKTGERLDAIGRGEAIAAHCVALLTQ